VQNEYSPRLGKAGGVEHLLKWKGSGAAEATWEMERIACEACKKESGDDSMLLCDGCDRGYHLHCLRPKLRGIPDGEWHCPVCLPMAEEDTKFCKGLEETWEPRVNCGVSWGVDACHY
jgi:hypothetical protein